MNDKVSGKATPRASSERVVELRHPFDQVALPEDVEPLQAIVSGVKERAERCRKWYDEKASKQAWKSRGLRWFSVLFVVLGGLCPLVPDVLIPAALSDSGFQPFGYVLLAAAAGVVVFDRAFGYSSSWMRYRMTQIRIERALSLYDVATATLLPGSDHGSANRQNNVRALIAETHKFLSEIEDLVVEETETWLNEFKAEHGRFQDQVSKREEPRAI